jgi:YVTN family beta-propeller protein
VGLKVILCVVCCALTAVASAQILERTVLLPDSLGGLSAPSIQTYDSRDNALYVAGRVPAVVVVDCSTGMRVARIPLRARADALCYDSLANVVYCSHSDSTLSVIDCDTRTVVATIPVPVIPCELLFVQAVNKLYFGTRDSGIGVVDCASRSFARFTSTGWCARFCLAPDLKRLYFRSGHGQVGAVDCYTDSIIALIELDCDAKMVFNDHEDKLYVHDGDFQRLYVVDAATNSVVKVVNGLLGNQNCNPLCLNVGLNKLYCTNMGNGTVSVLDCSTDAVVAEIAVGGQPGQPGMNELLKKLYVHTFSPGVCVIDCRGDSVVAQLPQPGNDWPDSMACYAAAGRVYTICPGLGLIAAVDCSGDTVLPEIVTGYHPDAVTNVPGHNKLYSTEVGGVTVLVLDAATGGIVRRVAPGGVVRQVMYNPVNDRVYAATRADSTVLKVFDPVRDSVVAGVKSTKVREPAGLVCNAVNGKVYCLDYNAANLLVVDGLTNSVLAEVTFMDSQTWGAEFSRSANKLYVALIGDNLEIYLAIVDGTTDSVRVCFPPGPRGLGTSVFATNDSLNRVYFGILGMLHMIDGAGDSVIVAIPTDWSYDILYSRVRNALYCLGDSAVTVRDGATLQPVASIPLQAKAGSLLLDTIADKLYCLDRHSDSLQVIDCATNQTLGVIALLPGSGAMAWCPEQRRVFVTHSSYSALSLIRDTCVAVAEGRSVPRGPRLTAGATIVRGALFQPEALGRKQHAPSWLLDISGRKVMALRPGANDIRHLAPGVYFVREEPQATSHRPQAIKKVVVAR